jgi:hypothetical protein
MLRILRVPSCKRETCTTSLMALASYCATTHTFFALSLVVFFNKL